MEMSKIAQKNAELLHILCIEKRPLWGAFLVLKCADHPLPERCIALLRDDGVLTGIVTRLCNGPGNRYAPVRILRLRGAC